MLDGLKLFKAPFTLRREIWKHSFISTVRPTVHTNPSRKWSFSKTLFKPEKFKTLALRFRVNEKHFENVSFRKRWRHDNHVISLPEFSTNPKWPLITVFSNFFGIVWTLNAWIKSVHLILQSVPKSIQCTLWFNCVRHIQRRETWNV